MQPDLLRAALAIDLEEASHTVNELELQPLLMRP